MLLELHIKDFAIIEDLSLDFKKGMTVLTGETGAGKSIIIDAVGLLAGGRGSTEFVRHGAKKCVLEGQFFIDENTSDKLPPLLRQYEIDLDGPTINIQREIYASGRTVCRVNGSIITIAVLKEIGSALIDIHGQNEHQELMHPETHINMLDYFGKNEIFPLRQEYMEIYKKYKDTKNRYEKWQYNEQEYAQKVDMLSFQVNEIEQANLQENEDMELEEEARKLANYQTIVEGLQTSYEAIQGGENSGLDRIGLAMEKMGTISDMDENFGTISENLQTAFYQLQESASSLYEELDNLEFDEARLNEIEERLDLIQQLKRKYGQSINDILDYFNQSSRELERLENREGDLDNLSRELTRYESELLKKGKELSKTRRSISNELEGSIHKQLEALYMGKVTFQVRFKDDLEDISSEKAMKNGVDQVEFYVSTNPGEPEKPLAKVASGGELSRLMLAIKTIFSSSQGITSIIFDEVDTGVSGRVAQSIADKIYSVAIHSQVLCISHLPQVAAMADQHLYISKTIQENRTTTHVDELSEEGKVKEVARMLSGAEITPLTIETAKELRKFSGNQREMVEKS